MKNNFRIKLLVIGLLCLFCVHVPNPVCAYTGHRPLWTFDMKFRVTSVDISADGSYTVAVTDPGVPGAGNFTLFSRSSSTPIWSQNLGSFSYKVVISENGEYIATGTNKAFLFDRTGAKLRTYPGCWVLDMSANGTYLAISHHGLCLYERDSPIPLRNYTLSIYPDELVISADGRFIAIGDISGWIYLFDCLSPSPLWTYKTGEGVSQLAISADGQYVAAGSYDHRIYCFNRTGLMWNYTIGCVYAISISPNGQWVAGGIGTKIYLFNCASAVPLWNYTLNNFDYSAWSLDFSADGRYLVAGTHYRIHLFQSNSSTPLWSFTPGGRTDDTVEALAISADGNYIAAGTEHGKIYLFHRVDEGGANVPGYGGVWLTFAITVILIGYLYHVKHTSRQKGRVKQELG